MIPSPSQLRAARAWLGWSRDQAAARAGICASTVGKVERGGSIERSTLELLRGAYGNAGMTFLGTDGVSRATPTRTGAAA